MLPKVAKSCQKLPKIPKDAKSCQKLPKVAKSYQMLPKVAKRCQKLPRDAKRCQKLPKVVKSYQKSPKVAKCCQKLAATRSRGQKHKVGMDKRTDGGTGGLLELLSQLKMASPPQKKGEKNLKCSVRPPPFGCLFHLLFRMKSHPNNDLQQKYIEKLNQLFQEMLSIPVISVITCHVSQVTCHVHQSNESLQTRNCFQPLLTSQPVTRKLLHTQIVRHVGMRTRIAKISLLWFV